MAAALLLPFLCPAQNVLDSREGHAGKVLSIEVSNSAKVYPSRYKGTPEEFVKQKDPLLEAFEKEGSLYIKDTTGRETLVAQRENPAISYGTSVSRNEFGIEGGIFWSDDQSKLAFYRKDESLVTDFPLLDIKTRTGKLNNIKYPMNGMDSEKISLGIYDVASGKTVWADVNDFGEDRYLTCVSWSPDSRYVFIQVLDRSQHHMKLNMYNAADGSFVRTLLTEDNEAWVEPEEPLYFIKGTYEFLYTTDNRDGFKNLYLCDTLGTVKRFTTVDADVKYVANDGKYVYYTSAEVSPAENHLFRLGLKKKSKPQRLTEERGWHNIGMSADFRCFIDNYSSFNNPGKVELRSTEGKLIRVLHESADPLSSFATGKVEFGEMPSADCVFMNNYRLFYPVDFDPAKKYPAIVYVYGGPHSHMVQDRWLGGIRMWEAVMAQRGYFVYVQDNRGTSNRGAAYEKAINRRCGQAEMEDQMVGIDWLRSLPFVDADRIGVHGWSYGGFMTLTLATSHPEVFKVAVAGGPVIDWKWYEIMYGERYMDTEATNPEGFALTGLVGKAKNLKARTLICQGAVDATVVWEHSLSFVQECVEQGVKLDYFPYPCDEHNMRGKARIHLYHKITDYFTEHL